MRATILVVDDDKDLLEMFVEVLRGAGYDVRGFDEPLKALEAFNVAPTDLVFTDLQMPGMGGIDLLRKIKQRDPRTPVIMASAVGTVNNAVQAMKEGAFDFLTKPVDLGHFLELVNRAHEFKELKHENMALKTQVADLRGSRIAPVGTSAEMKEVLRMARTVADTDATVLLIGETGTGKEVLADVIQHNSSRRNSPYVRVNCASLSGTLLESELFGHEKGAFTGATERRSGRFEQAQKGTIFLDEIGEMTMEAQVRLLRVLQQREMQRVGSSQTISLDIRVICATNRDLKAEVAAKRFREDLFYRVNVFPLLLPPLRQRKRDIPALCMDLLHGVRARLGRGPTDISQAALDKLTLYSWPGNVRELENLLERCSILCAAHTLDVDDLPEEILVGAGASAPVSAAAPAAASAPAAVGETLEAARQQTERESIIVALEKCHWNMSKAAKMLGISRSTLYVKLDQYKIEH
jgi:DNA-binding NtrC family response regulator